MLWDLNKCFKHNHVMVDYVACVQQQTQLLTPSLQTTTTTLMHPQHQMCPSHHCDMVWPSQSSCFQAATSFSTTAPDPTLFTLFSHTLRPTMTIRCLILDVHQSPHGSWHSRPLSSTHLFYLIVTFVLVYCESIPLLLVVLLEISFVLQSDYVKTWVSLGCPLNVQQTFSGWLRLRLLTCSLEHKCDIQP